MAPTHWSDLANSNQADGDAQRVSSRPNLVRNARPSLHDRHLQGVANGNPHFANLLEQRQQLEQKMQRALAGGQPQIDARDAQRFQVPTMAQRRADYRAWENAREEARASTPATGGPEVGRALPSPYDQIRPLPLGDDGPPLPMRPTMGETGRASPLNPARWMAQHDDRRSAAPSRPSRRRRGRPPLRPRPRRQADDGYRDLDARLQRARSRADEVGRAVTDQNPLRDLDRQFEDADRRLAAEGMDDERRDLARMKQDMGLDNLTAPLALPMTYFRNSVQPQTAAVMRASVSNKIGSPGATPLADRIWKAICGLCAS
ncbi:MAG: hypothetical protein HC843_11505 [Sphingomonadales bacterium]|nr:hypothetical protein [Sphingomonadales bacterium]